MATLPTASTRYGPEFFGYEPTTEQIKVGINWKTVFITLIVVLVLSCICSSSAFLLKSQLCRVFCGTTEGFMSRLIKRNSQKKRIN